MEKFKININAPVVLGFAGLCLLATVLGMVSDGRLTQMFFMTHHSSLANPMTWLRFFTHVLGHASWAHFMGNTMYLLLLGPLLEEKYGAKQLVSVILIAVLFIGQQIIDSITVQDNISNMGHIIGGMVGSFAGYQLNKK